MDVVHVPPVNVKALNVEFFHGVSAPEESIKYKFELKFSGTATVSVLFPMREQARLITQASSL